MVFKLHLEIPLKLWTIQRVFGHYNKYISALDDFQGLVFHYNSFAISQKFVKKIQTSEDLDIDEVKQLSFCSLSIA